MVLCSILGWGTGGDDDDDVFLVLSMLAERTARDPGRMFASDWWCRDGWLWLSTPAPAPLLWWWWMWKNDDEPGDPVGVPCSGSSSSLFLWWCRRNPPLLFLCFSSPPPPPPPLRTSPSFARLLLLLLLLLPALPTPLTTPFSTSPPPTIRGCGLCGSDP